jgi:hypothetical protein
MFAKGDRQITLKTVNDDQFSEFGYEGIRRNLPQRRH